MSRPIAYLTFPQEPQWRPLPFYLAAEEFAATRLDDGCDYFFCWRVKPTVICGRNQLIASEVNLPFCSREGIDVVRRKSGGGAVYADPDNVMLSFITPIGRDVASTFEAYTSLVVGMLREAGFAAEPSERNDVLICGRKVSGGAFYRIGRRAVSHGTMLTRINPRAMDLALTPSRSKLRSKGVESVRARVTSLSEHREGFDAEAFMDLVAKTMGGNERPFTPSELSEIETMALDYRKPEWVEGHNPRANAFASMRIEPLGEVCAALALDFSSAEHPEGVIHQATLHGDFLHPDLPLQSLLSPLKGTPFLPGAIAAAVDSLPLPAQHLLPGLSKPLLRELLCSAN